MLLTGIKSVSELAKGIIDRIWPPEADANEKLKAQVQIEAMLQQRENLLVDSTREIIVAEMNQGDSYTKRARPTIVYSGLAFIFLVHVFFPIAAFFTGEAMPEISLPAEFWWTWGGVCSVWVYGRSMEKRGSHDKLTKLITGG
jgi:hypothetical protein